MDREADLQAVQSVAAVPARNWTAAVLLFAFVLALITAWLSMVVAVAVVPLGDLTPLVVLLTALVSRHWGDDARLATRAASVLAAVMLFEMLVGVPLIIATVNGVAPWIRVLSGFGVLLWVYPAELIVLLVVFGYASVRRAIGIIRTTNPLPTAAEG